MPLTLASTSQSKLTRILQQFFRRQGQELLAKISLQTLQSQLPLDLSHWTDSMMEAVRPTMAEDWQRGWMTAYQRIARLVRQGKALGMPIATPRLAYKRFGGPQALKAYFPPLQRGLDGPRRFGGIVTKAPKMELNFDVFNPRTLDAINASIYQFCRETNQTIVGDVNTAIDRLRRQMRQGLPAGDALRTMTQRVRTIFSDPYRAFRIAATETSRAIHGGQLLAAKDSGVVNRKRWLASADACKNCLALNGKEVDLDEPFIILPKGGPYAIVMYPPYHPFCFCSWTEVLAPKKERLQSRTQSQPISQEPQRVLSSAAPVEPVQNPWAKGKLDTLAREIAWRLKEDAKAEEARRILLKEPTPVHKEQEATRYDYKKLVLSLEKTAKELAELPPGPKRDRIKEQWNKSFEKRIALSDQLQGMKGRLAEEKERILVRALQPSQIVSVQPDFRGGINSPPVGPDVRSRVQDVCRLLSKVVGRSRKGETLLSIPFQQIPPFEEQRSYQQSGTVYLTPATDKKTILHEIGHALEHQFPKAAEAVRGFWQLRCGKKARVSMAQRFGAGYGAGEEGCEDDFGKVFGKGTEAAAYTGKRYKNGETEILSMGLQAMYDDPKGFAKKDPQYFALIAGILRGDYR